MKSFAFRIILVLVLLTIAAPAYAQRPTGVAQGKPIVPPAYGRPSGTPGTFAKDALMRRAETRKTVVERIVSIFRQRLDRYQDFLVKVETRRDKLKDQGVTVVNLDAFIVKAKANVKTTKTAIDASETALMALDYTGEYSEVMTTVREEFQKVRKAFTDLHKSMSEAVREIRQKSTQ